MRVIRFEEMDSTQVYAKQLVREGETDFVVVADTQVCGTGRHGRTWGSPRGGLWFSFVCQKPKELPNEVFYLCTLAIGVCVKNLLEQVFDIELKIKWPNDILMNGKKICGILCEKIGESLICGIGINSNVLMEALVKYNPMATSLVEETGKRVENIALMEQIIEVCTQKIQRLAVEKESIIKELNEALAYKGEKRYLTYLEKEAEIIGVDENGCLIVVEEGAKKHILAGEIL